jgi:hypothetical protein
MVGLSLLLLVFSVVRSVCAQDTAPSQPNQPSYETRVSDLPRFPHDPLAFTQGLIWHEGWLYESTGIPSAQDGAILSSLRRVDPLTGEVAQQFDLTIAVMGCRVNGPGETDDADLGLWCGPTRVNLKRGTEVVGAFTYDEIIPRLRQELDQLISQLGSV